MTFQNVLDTFFLRDDQDAYARSQGWEDAAQMVYYENLAMQEQSQQDALLHELAKVDPREIHSEDEACPLALWYDTSDELVGVY